MPRIRRALPLLTLALAFSAFPAGAQASITEYSNGLTAGSAPENIVTGPDGNLWFTQPGGNGSIGRMDAVTRQVTEFPTPTKGSQPADIAVGPDGNLWFTEEGGAGAIGRITPAGTITEFTAGLTGMNDPEGITAGPDGNLWFTESGSLGRVGRITPAGVITEFPLLNFGSGPTDIAAGEDGNLWFTEQRDPGRIGRITPTGIVTEFTEGLTPDSGPNQIVAADDGKLYFTMEANPGRVGRIKTDGKIDEYGVPTANSRPAGITEGGDGALWFAQNANPGGLGRLFEDSVLEFAGGTALGFSANSAPHGITRGPDGNVWFTETAYPARIGHITVPPGADIDTPESLGGGSVRFAADVRPNAQATTYRFQYGTDFAQQTDVADAGAGPDPVGVGADVAGLALDADHQVRVTATNASGTTTSAVKAFYLTATGEVVKEKPPRGTGDGSSTVVDPAPTATAPAVAVAQTATQVAAQFPPVLGESVVVAPVSGTVLIKAPGGKLFKRLARGLRVRIGSTLDTRKGTVELISARNRTGGSQKGTFWGGIFQVRQTRTSRGLTDLVLRAGSFAACPSGAGKARASVLARDSGGTRRVVRRLWGKDRHARFRTHGRDSVATVRGTVWSTTDRCDGTLTTVKQGKVSVRNRRSGRSVLLTAGRSYLARHR